MGLEASIEKVFRHTMESDLELIAQNVSASNGSNTTPQGSCMCACNISAAVIQSNDQRPEEQLYSVQQIVFQPVNFPKILEERIEEANAHQEGGHGPHLDTLRTLLEEGPSITDGHAKLLAQSKVRSLIGIYARHYQEEGPNVTIVVRSDRKVITLGVMDYVQKELSRDRDAIKRLVEQNELRITEIPSLERWPEEVAITAEAGRGSRVPEVYLRADLAFKPDPQAVSNPQHHPRPWALHEFVKKPQAAGEKTDRRSGEPGHDF
jgi:hypothetical protein